MLMRCLEPVFPRIAGPPGGCSGLSPAQPSLLRSGAIASVASLSEGPPSISTGPGGWAQPNSESQQLPRTLRMNLERGKRAEEGDMTPANQLGGLHHTPAGERRGGGRQMKSRTFHIRCFVSWDAERGPERL